MINRDVASFFVPPLLLLAALLQATAATRLRLLGVKPDLVLLILLIATLIYGMRPGLLWAFLGGVAIDIFSGGPIGGTSLALLPAAIIAGFGHSVFSRFNVFVPLGVAVLGTLVYNLAYIGVLNLLNVISTIPFAANYPIPQIELPLNTTLRSVTIPTMFYNMALMLLATPLLNRVPETPDSA